jgi:hypothetical protein
MNQFNIVYSTIKKLFIFYGLLGIMVLFIYALPYYFPLGAPYIVFFILFCFTVLFCYKFSKIDIEHKEKIEKETVEKLSKE